MVVTVPEDEVISHIEDSLDKSPSLKFKALVYGNKEGWYNLSEEIEKASADFERPQGEEATCCNDTCLLYFTSGTTGMPKMVQHNYKYPLGHIVTAKYWQDVQAGIASYSCRYGMGKSCVG